jgi:GNAT superfamily N-acetyltransferase
MTSRTVRSASRAEEGAISALTLLAFGSDPMARWSLSDAQTYLTVMPGMIRAFGASAYDEDSAYVTDDLGGAALWLPPGVEPDVEMLEQLVRTNADPAILPDVEKVFEAMAHYHPQEPHWYLPLIAVDPTRQGQGIGGALMRHALARCDREGTAAYLESSNPRNIPLYQRHGFEILGRIQVGSSPVLTPMLRPPRPGSAI